MFLQFSNVKRVLDNTSWVAYSIFPSAGGSYFHIKTARYATKLLQAGELIDLLQFDQILC